jgi:hypothetical protein
MDEQTLHPSPSLLHGLERARAYVGDTFLPACYADELRQIRDTSDLARIDRDQWHPLWWFLPPVAQDLFGDINVLHSFAEDTRSPFRGLCRFGGRMPEEWLAFVQTPWRGTRK